jgi:hypothetical protein
MTSPALRAATVTPLRSRPGYQPDCAALARNRLAIARTCAGMPLRDFAALLSQMTGREITGGNIETWETRATPPGDVLVAADAVSPAAPQHLGLRSHKFICGHAGQDATAILAGLPGMADGACAGLPCRSQPLACPSGECTLHVWPSGAVVFHLAEDVEFAGVAGLAVWRVATYEENLAWASSVLRSLTGDAAVAASYVLSLYWVDQPAWAGQLLATGMRLLCSPRVLLDHPGSAGAPTPAEAERALLAGGYEHAGMRPFGMRGVSSGFASWSGVSYFPADPARALAEDELVDFELGLQAAWVYCEHVLGLLEDGQPPDTADGYGWRFLRALRARLANQRPTETGQYQAMRAAVIETSGILAMLGHAIEALREDERP